VAKCVSVRTERPTFGTATPAAAHRDAKQANTSFMLSPAVSYWSEAVDEPVSFKVTLVSTRNANFPETFDWGIDFYAVEDIPAEWAKIRQGLDIFRISSKYVLLSIGEV